MNSQDYNRVMTPQQSIAYGRLVQEYARLMNALTRACEQQDTGMMVELDDKLSAVRRRMAIARQI